MKFTLTAWWCGACHTRNEPSYKRCFVCHHPRIEKHAQVHVQDRAVVYYNPATGEHRTPARADAPMPEVYAKQGFERQEILSMSAYERQSGVVHEASNFNSGNAPLVEEPQPLGAPKEVKDQIINDMRDAIASGPWTMDGLPLDKV